MRKNLFYFVLMAVSLVTTLSSCKKDNGNDVDYAIQIAKSYPGTLIVGGISTPYTIDISRTGINLIKLELKNFSYIGMNLGDIVLDNIALTKNGNDSIRFSSENKSITVDVEGASVDLKGASLDDDLTITMSIKDVLAEPIPVYFTTGVVDNDDVAEGGEIWTAMDGAYNGTFNPGDVEESVTVEKTGGYSITITIPSLSFLGMPEGIPISIPATVTEDPDGTCSFTGTFLAGGGTLTGKAKSVGNITFTATAFGTTIEYIGSK